MGKVYYIYFAIRLLHCFIMAGLSSTLYQHVRQTGVSAILFEQQS